MGKWILSLAPLDSHINSLSLGFLICKMDNECIFTCVLWGLKDKGLSTQKDRLQCLIHRHRIQTDCPCFESNWESWPKTLRWNYSQERATWTGLVGWKPVTLLSSALLFGWALWCHLCLGRCHTIIYNFGMVSSGGNELRVLWIRAEALVLVRTQDAAFPWRGRRMGKGPKSGRSPPRCRVYGHRENSCSEALKKC